ncbi:PREDICTED: uncharacterized protein LOC104815380 isoform X1 [Tarenaya hassleriana]|uniref:uncharacterized protein LOC104815380 isoform X1 n=1 Tax=Tarenaya hassleriana TaxID=28532 RepID=UPI00053C21C2|nr:PREDICTED: uncharacterized protein LOC104815380 isoform X1 [Tarenaya hassleriana]XP_010542052.1 PREDICTED: uncharacterized protein LOC104815380 isoform X1 [Tarenaya hassleriana]
MATLGGGGAIGVPSFSRVSINTRTLASSLSLSLPLPSVSKWDNELRCVVLCSAVQESSASASASAVATEKKEEKGDEKREVETETETEAAPVKKPKPAASAAKAAVKPLPQMMEEDVIPPLKSILESQDDVADIELSFQDNKVVSTAGRFFPEKGYSILVLGVLPERKPHRSEGLLHLILRLRSKHGGAISGGREETDSKPRRFLGRETTGSTRNHSCVE